MSVVKKTLDTVLRGAGVTFIGLNGLNAYSVKNPKPARVMHREMKRITFEDEISAARALKRLREIAHIRTTVSVYDLYDILGLETDRPYTDRLWGWTLSDLQVVRVYRDGAIWRIEFPKVSRLARPRRKFYNA